MLTQAKVMFLCDVDSREFKELVRSTEERPESAHP